METIEEMQGQCEKSTKRRYKCIMGIFAGLIMIAICLAANFYMQDIQNSYPEYVLSQEELYESLNLKDFKVEGNRIISLTGDPWITYKLDEKVIVKVIELDFGEIQQGNYWGEIFDTDTWSTHRYYLKKGKVLVYFNEPEEMQNLRFDLVSSDAVTLELEQIIINGDSLAEQWNLVKVLKKLQKEN